MSKKNKKESPSAQNATADAGNKQDTSSRFYPKGYSWTTLGPGTVIIIGILLMAVGDPWADYVVIAGVAFQLATVVWQIRQVKISRSKAQAGRN